MKTSSIKGTAYLTIATFVFMITGYFINIFLGNYLGPSKYGIYGVIISLITYINIMFSSGFTQAVSKFTAEDESKKDVYLMTGLLLQFIFIIFFFCLFYLFSENIASLFNDIQLAPYIKIAAFSFPLYGIYALYADFYNGLHMFKKQALMNILYSISKITLILVFLLLFELNGVFYGVIFAPLLAVIVGFYLPKTSTNNFPFRRIIKFALPLIAFGFIVNLLQMVDLFFVKTLLKVDEATGFYTASQNIARIPFYCMSAIFYVIYPLISRSVSANQHDKTKLIIQESVRIVFLLLAPLAILMSQTSSELILLIYSKTYLPASSSLSILVIGVCFFTIFTVFSYILSGAGKPKISLYISIISLIVAVSLCFILIPTSELSGAAIAMTIGSFIAMIVGGLYIYKIFHKPFKFKSLLNIGIASFVMYITLKFIHFPTVLLPVIYLLLFMIYFLVLFFLREINKKDLDYVYQLIPSRLVAIARKK